MIALYIFLAILLFIALLICAVLCIPVKIFITYSEENGFDYKIKISFYTLKSDPEKNTLSETLGKLKKFLNTDLSEVDAKKTKPSSVAKHGILSTVKDVFGLLKTVLSYLSSVLGSVVVNKLELDIICADKDDTAEAATDYGKVCAVTYPVLGFIHSYFKVKKRKERINITCDYLAEKPSFSLNTVLSIRVFHILKALMPTLKSLIKKAIKNSQNSIEKSR